MLLRVRRKILDFVRRVVGTQFVIDSLRRDIQQLSMMIVTREARFTDLNTGEFSLISAVPAPNEAIGNNNEANNDSSVTKDEGEVVYKVLWMHERMRVKALARENEILRNTLEKVVKSS